MSGTKPVLNMHQRGDLRRISVLALSIAIFGGCSAYEVRDAYVALGTETGVFSFKQEDAQVHIWAISDTRLFAIGPPGAPVVPTNVSSEPNAIRMQLQLHLHRDLDFSLAQRPCLSVEDRPPLCASEVEVWTSASYQDDGSMHSDKKKRWQSIVALSQPRVWKVELAPQNDGGRIDRKRVYQHYGYTGKPEFGSLRLNVLYVHSCSGTCPKQFSLNPADFVSVESLPVPDRRIDYEKKQQSSYRPLAPVQ